MTQQRTSAMDFQTQYRYRDINLARHEIRLLDLSPGHRDSPVQGTLRNVLLPENPLFETISYAWGDANKRCIIYLDGKPLSVPASTAAVLKTVRHSHRVRALWIDAVCINQSHTREKNHQVALMRSIFSHGHRGLIYFGEADAILSAKVGRAITDILRDCEGEINSEQGWEQTLRDAQGNFRYSLLPFTRQMDFESLGILAAAPWCHRLWTKQEAALADESICHYGSLQVNLTHVVVAFVWLYHKRDFIPGDLFASPSLQLCAWLNESVTLGQGVWRNVRERQSGYSAASALRQGASLLATEPKDHVYGMLGLMNCTTVRIPLELEPDYSKSDAETFSNATKYAIKEDGIGSVLRYVGHRSLEELTDPQWPSWVPKWYRPLETPEDCTILSPNFTAGVTEQQAPPNLTASDQTLRLVGYYIGTVKEVCPKFTNECLSDAVLLKSMLAHVRRLCDIPFSKRRRFKEPGKVPLMVKTLLAGTNYHHQNVTEMELMAYETFMDRLSLRGEVPAHPDSSPSLSDEEGEQALRFAQAFQSATRNRRFLVTTKGSFGLGPASTTQGDGIVILDGGPTPYILREVAQRQYRLVGECYVAGVMHGEAMRERQDLGESMEGFEII